MAQKNCMKEYVKTFYYSSKKDREYMTRLISLIEESRIPKDCVYQLPMSDPDPITGKRMRFTSVGGDVYTSLGWNKFLDCARFFLEKKEDVFFKSND